MQSPRSTNFHLPPSEEIFRNDAPLPLSPPIYLPLRGEYFRVEKLPGRRRECRLGIFLRLIDSLKCTHPFLFALQQVESAGPLDARKEPDRMRAYKPLDQGDVAGDLAARIFCRGRRSTGGRRAFRGQRLLALK